MSLFVFRATLAHTLPPTVAEMTADHPLSAILFPIDKRLPTERETERVAYALSLSVFSSASRRSKNPAANPRQTIPDPRRPHPTAKPQPPNPPPPRAHQTPLV